jgi:hypothetical protein
MERLFFIIILIFYQIVQYYKKGPVPYRVIWRSDRIGKSFFAVYLILSWMFYDELVNFQGNKFQTIVRNHNDKNISTFTFSLIFHRIDANRVLISTSEEEIKSSHSKLIYSYFVLYKNEFCVQKNSDMFFRMNSDETFFIKDACRSSAQMFGTTTQLFICSLGQKRPGESAYEKFIPSPLPDVNDVKNVFSLLKEKSNAKGFF